MAHRRADSSKLSTSISLTEELFEKIDTHWHEKRFYNRSQAIADLITKGLKYEEMLKKKKERNK